MDIKRLTCCNCGHPLSDNQLVKDGYNVNTTASWAKVQLKIMAEMAEDHKLPDWVQKEAYRIMDGLRLLP
jgi:hypothetical protein